VFRHGRRGVQGWVYPATHFRGVAEVGLPRRVGVAELHHAHGLVIGEHSLKLHAAKEQGLVRAGALLRDARDAGLVIVPEAEGLGAAAQSPLTNLEGEGVVEDDDERTAGSLLLQLLQEHEEEGFDPLVFVEPAVPRMPVEVFLADM
jgi:hypothetical protein